MSTLAVTIQGSGLPVILLHGFPLNGAIWQQQSSLSEKYQLIVPDLTGFGATPYQSFSLDSLADAVLNILLVHDIQKAIILGHSMGGYVALSFAEKYPDRLLGLGLIASHPFADNSAGKSSRIEMIDRIKKEGKNFVADVMTEKVLSTTTKKNNPEVVTRLKAVMNSVQKETIINAQEAMMMRKDLSFILLKLKIPVAFIFGEFDSMIPEERRKEVHSLQSKAFYSVIADSGHMPMMEQPQKFNEELDMFLSPISF